MRIRLRNFAVCATIALLIAGAGTTCRAGVVLSIDAAGVQSSTVPGVITEDFNSFAPGTYSTLSTAVGTLTTSGAFQIQGPDQYGGAGGTGEYFTFGAQSGSADPVTLTFNGPQSYFGMWWSAADANNTVQFYSGGTLEATYTTASIFGGISNSYYGNPNGGGDSGEPFAYLNINGMGGTTFTSVVFSNTGTTSTGFESDNWSVASVPEPSSLVLGGMAAAAGALATLWRRRRGGPASSSAIV
jgi:hypothetical protein